MDFKINTTSSYVLIAPVSGCADANLTAALRQKWKELTESGSQNLIVDMQYCQDTTEHIRSDLPALHDTVYAAGCSLVFIHMPPALLKNHDTAGILNIAPTLSEAVDIIHMELLERELMQEDDPEEG